MTSMAWNNTSYYGKKLKRDFTHLHTLTEKAFKKITDGEMMDPYEMNTFLMMLKHKTTLTREINNIIKENDTTKRIENIERLLEAIPVEVLAEAQVKLGK